VLEEEVEMIKEVKLPMRNEMKTTGLKMRSNLDSIRTETGKW
jgi:hypothetical protein